MGAEILPVAMFVTLLFAVMLGHPLGITLGALAILFGYIGVGPGVFFILVSKTYGLMTNYVLVAIPLFILMAEILSESGVSEDLFESMYVVMGQTKGGLALATVIISILLAATTGIVGASVVGMGLLAAPAMMKRNYSKSLTAGTIIAGGTLGILIPPSIMLVVYGAMIGMSVGKLFAAAAIPGVSLGVLYLVYVFVYCNFINPKAGPPIPKSEDTYTAIQKILLTLKSMAPPLLLIFAVLGSIVVGIATPTEAAGLGCLGAILIAGFNKKINFTMLKSTAYSTLKITCMVMLIFVGANLFSAVFLDLGGGEAFKNLLLGISSNRWVIFSIMMFIIFLLGMFVDWLGILLIIVPIFTPIAVNILGFSPLWFAMMVSINLQMSFLTPPFGYSLFYFKGVAPPGMTMLDIYKGIVPFVVIQATGLVVFALVPQLITWLPSALFK